MRVLKDRVVAAGAMLLLGSVSWGCVVPECTQCSNAAAGADASGGTATFAPDETDCMDEVDNDFDGDVDCADIDCESGYECALGPPEGWKGPYKVSVVDYFEELPVCDDGAAPDVFFAEPAGPVECASCSCGPLEGASCEPPPFSCWPGSPTCTGTETDLTSVLADGQCHKPPNLGQVPSTSCRLIGDSSSASGMCAPFGGTPVKGDPWAKRVGVCQLSAGGGCSEAQTCVTKDAGAGKHCIRAFGDVACPSALSVQKTLVYADGDDTRSCTPCTCDVTSANCSGGSYTVHDTNNCSIGLGDPRLVIDSGSCLDVSMHLDGGSWSMTANLPQPQGACTPGGGQPEGQVTPRGPVTFCCPP